MGSWTQLFYKILLVTVTIPLFWTVKADTTTCKKINSCKCSYDNGEFVDLSPLIGDPRWLDQYGPQSVNAYSYNPCKPFDEGSCKDVAVCQNTGFLYYPLGTQESAEFSVDQQTGALSVVYSSTDALGIKRTSQIVTQCARDELDKFQALGETSPGSGYYLFTLSSVHCCPVPKPRDQLSIGTEIIMGFFGLVIIYLALGMFVQKCIRKQTGRHVIPSYTFWSGIPSLVRDGCIIFFSCGKHSTYESL